MAWEKNEMSFFTLSLPHRNKTELAVKIKFLFHKSSFIMLITLANHNLKCPLQTPIQQ